METGRLAASCEYKVYYPAQLFFCSTCIPSISGFKTVNTSNAFRLNFLALFEIFWVCISANLT